MCGIGGWFSPAPRPADGLEALRRLGRAIAHRGPDGMAEVETEHAGLFHARLAIIDLVSGDQPMWSSDGRAVIVFNGEIFNYRDLRKHYEARGFTFRTHSDTEVVIASWLIDGERGFDRLRGMFAFALWDTAQHCGLLVRDALGIKPMFVHTGSDGMLRFASEAKGIVALLDAAPQLDPGALHELLNFRYLPGESTLFRGIRQLAPGEILHWRPDASPQQRRLTPVVPAGGGDLDAVLADSVQAHLIADVPIGCYLSGGIDSGLIAALARKSGASVPTFTLALGDDPAEARNAAATARALGLANLQAELGNEETRELPRMLWHLETPKVNAVQLFRLAALARTQVKATLSGLGGDELFAGYTVHRVFHRLGQLPAGPTRLVSALAEKVRRLLPDVPFCEDERALEIGRHLDDWPRVYALLRNVWDRPLLRRWLYGPRLLDATLPDPIETIRADWRTDLAPFEAMLQFEWRNKMVNDLLWQEDRASMAVGLEVRVPFVDVVVRDAVARLVTPRPGKAALREVAARHLPRDVLARPKSGFQLNAPAFFNAHLRPLAKVWLAPDRVREYGLFNPATVDALLRLPPRRRYRWHFFMLYLMIQAHYWVEIFERGRAPGDLADGR